MGMTLQQLENRRIGLGGSDASAVLGLNHFKTPLQVFMEKVQGLTGFDEQEDNGPSYFGNILEPIVAEEFSKKTGLQVEIKSEQLVHPEYPFIIGNLDRFIVGENAFLECKTTSAWNDKFWEGDEVPLAYIIQCMHYMALTGFDAGYIAVLIGGNQFKWKKIERNEELIKKIIDKEVFFWKEFVEKKVPPVVDGSPASSELVKFLYPKAKDGEVIRLDEKFNDSLSRRETLKEELKKLQFEYDEIENTVKMFMGEFPAAINDVYKIDWKNVSQMRLDGKRLEEEMPDIYKKYLSPSSYRRMTITNLLLKKAKKDKK